MRAKRYTFQYASETRRNLAGSPSKLGCARISCVRLLGAVLGCELRCVSSVTGMDVCPVRPLVLQMPQLRETAADTGCLPHSVGAS